MYHKVCNPSCARTYTAFTQTQTHTHSRADIQVNTPRIYQANPNISELTGYCPLIADLVSVDPADKALLSLWCCTLVAAAAAAGAGAGSGGGGGGGAGWL